MMSAQRALRDLAPVREDVVRQVGNLVSSGRYQPNAQAIADAMLGAEGATSGE